MAENAFAEAHGFFERTFLGYPHLAEWSARAYLEDASEIMIAFSKSVAEESVDDFRFHAHAFKSGAANIGANFLVETCSKLEVITEKEFSDRRFEYLAKIEQQVADIRDCLEAAWAPDRDKLSTEKAALI